MKILQHIALSQTVRKKKQNSSMIIQTPFKMWSTQDASIHIQKIQNNRMVKKKNSFSNPWLYQKTSKKYYSKQTRLWKVTKEIRLKRYWGRQLVSTISICIQSFAIILDCRKLFSKIRWEMGYNIFMNLKIMRDL